MLKYAVAMLCGLSLTGNVYMAGWGTARMCGTGEEGGDCCTPPSRAQMLEVSATVAGEDMKNTKCIVSGDDVGTGKGTVSYKGKVYHICCEDCTAPFNKEPEKYVKAMQADPAKFGLKK